MGQVAGFDDETDAFLELSTARVKDRSDLATLMTLIVLRLDGEEYSLNGPLQAMRGRWAF